MAEKWIDKAIEHPGALKKKAARIKGGINKEGNISAKGMAKLAKSDNPTTKRQVALAKTLKKMH